MKSPITAILIDDEFSALKGLQQKLDKNHAEVEILNTFQQPEEAIKYLTKHKPDLVFLDIQMPRITGFELLAALKEIKFQFIFVTAYNEFALNALKVSAVDYILKPVDDDDLSMALSKAKKNIIEKENTTQQKKIIKLLSKTISTNNKIVIPTASGLSFIPQEDVLHLEGYEGYTKFHLVNGEEILSSYNLGKFEKKLDPQLFFKCHKSHIIQLGKVRYLENEGYILLENKKRIPISRANKKIFLDFFK